MGRLSTTECTYLPTYLLFRCVYLSHFKFHSSSTRTHPASRDL